MTGVILETLNSKKLFAFFGVILAFQVVFFLLGGLIAPSPNTSERMLSTKCIDRSLDPLHNKEWFFTRPFNHSHSCKETLVDGDLSEVVPHGVTGDQIVFVIQYPLPKNNHNLRMTRWFQQMVAVLTLDIRYHRHFQVEQDSVLTFDVRLGYRNHDDPVHEWKELAHSSEKRPLNCKLDPEAKHHINHSHSISDHFYYDCEILPLFTLGSIYYDYYLVNIRIPSKERIGSLQDLWLVEIHQNGGFTQVWFALKTFICPFNLLALIFFWRRVSELERKPTFLERTTLAMGIMTSILNLPIEWFSLVINVPFWLLLSDIRQGAFYTTLVCFWLVFTGEHLMDSSQNVSTPSWISVWCEKWGLSKQYWSKLILVAGASISLCIFELAERGVQLYNPFYTIWSHPTAAKIGFSTVLIGVLCAVVYLIYLGFLVTKAFISILGKRKILHTLPEERRGIIYRFSILLAYTILCAFLTVVFFICSQLNEDRWKFGEHSLEYTSAFITGVYGMWNLYVFTVLCLYAPSHKFRSEARQQLLDHSIPDASSTDGIQLEVVSGGRTLRSQRAFQQDGFKFLQKTAFE